MFIWAHRGASGEFAENTLLAFEQAIQQGTDGVELDVIQVEDEFYIWHNRYPAEEVCAESDPLHTLMFYQQSKDFVNGLQLPQNQRVPTLSQALQCIAGRADVNVELKHVNDINLLWETLCLACQQYSFEPEQLLISSFNHYLLEDFQNKTTQFPIGVLLASSMNYFDTLLQRLNPFSIHFDINCLVPEDIKKAHELGLKCFVYTVDKESDIKSLQKIGVDGIYSNFPARSRSFL